VDHRQHCRENLESSSSSVVTYAKIHLGGRPHLKARNTAAAVLLAESEQRDATRARLRQLCEQGAPMTTLTVDRAGSVTANEGRGIIYQDRPMLLNKGSKSRGHYLDDPRSEPVAVTRGFGGQDQLAAAFHAKLDDVPEVRPADYDGVPDEAQRTFNADGSEPIAAVYLLDHPGFGPDGESATAGVMFMATDMDREDGIVNGYLWVPEESGMYAEFGSQYTRDLERMGGRVVDYEPGRLSTTDCMRTLPGTRGEAYRAVTGQSYQQD
jgi:hypothetical protein